MEGLSLQQFHQWLIEALPRCSYTLDLSADLSYHPAYQRKDFLGTLLKHPMEYTAESTYRLDLTKDYFEKDAPVKIALKAKTLEGLQTVVRQECLLTPQEQQAEIHRIVQGVSERMNVA